MVNEEDEYENNGNTVDLSDCFLTGRRKENGEIETGGIESQTRCTMDNVKKVLALAACDLQDVVKVSVWLDDTRDFWTFNRIYTEYFGDNPPARSCVQSAMMVDCKIEIEVTAYKPL